MSVAQIVLAVILFVLSAVFAVLGIRQLQCRGYCFNNAYIYASKQEREQMYLRPYYKQSGIVFLLLSGLLLLNCVRVIFELEFLFYVSIVILAATVVFAVVSSVIIEKKNK